MNFGLFIPSGAKRSRGISVCRINYGKLSSDGELFTGCLRCKLVTSIVIGMICVAFDPFKCDRVLSLESVELFPQISVFYRLFAWYSLYGSEPRPPFPAFQPLSQTILHILRISRDQYITWLLECTKSRYDGLELHAIVSGCWFAAVEFFFVVPIS